MPRTVQPLITSPAAGLTPADNGATAPDSTVAADCGRGGAAVETVAFVSLGCPKNLVDSEKMLGLLAEDGLSLVSEHEAADAIVVNTCGFLEASKQESLEVIAEAAERKRAGTLKRLIVAGCLVQRHRAKMLEWAPDIDALIGVFDRDHIVEAVRGTKPKRQSLGDPSSAAQPSYWIAGNAIVAAEERGMNVARLTVNGKDGRGIGYFESDAARLRLTPRHYAYLRVSEGCNQRCAFCTIPSIRGKMRSKPVEVIVGEARELFADGAFELNLIGQDTTSFGHDIGYEPGLVGMLTALNDAAAQNGGAWIRLMYAYPSCFTDEMIDAIGSLEHIVKYIDMPLQHINDRVLDSMRRNTSRAQIEELLHKLRERIPGIAIRTTFITGFPGETEAEHEELLEFVDEFGFDMMGVFEYSPEPGTRAYRMESDSALLVPAETKKRRLDELMQAQQRVAFEQAAYLANFYRGAADNGASMASKSESSAAALEAGLQFDVLIDRATDTRGVATAGVSEAAAANGAGRALGGRGDGGRLYIGRCYHQAPQVDSVTYVHSRERLSPGELTRCVIVDSDGYDLIARPTADLEKRRRLPVLS